MTAVFNKEKSRGLERSVKDGLAKQVAMKQSLGESTIVCSEHGNFVSNGVLFMGRREIWTPCPDCEEARLAALRHAEAQALAERARIRMEAALGQAAIPKRFQDRSLDNFVATSLEQQHALSVAREFSASFSQHAARGEGIVMSGLPGTGKSHLATAILQSVMPGSVGLYVTCSGLIRAVRATWSRDSERTETDVLHELGTVALLVIDEVGVSGGTENEQSLIFEVLDRRYRDMRPTILLTNLDKTGFKTFVGDRVFDRLTETARWVTFDWGSYRLTARKQYAEPGQRLSNPSNEPHFHRTSTGT